MLSVQCFRAARAYLTTLGIDKVGALDGPEALSSMVLAGAGFARNLSTGLCLPRNSHENTPIFTCAYAQQMERQILHQILNTS